MKPISGFKAEAPATSYPMLPKGLYTAGIKAVKIDGKEPDQRLIIRLEIIEGEYAGYYTKRYQNDSANSSDRYEVRYKGDFAIQIPDQANPRRQHFDWDLKSFNGNIWAIEDSNPGYHWDWNEQGLVGKVVGINVRQGSFNGVSYTTIGRLESTQMMKAGKCKVMADMQPRMTSAATPTPPANTMVVDEEVPF